MSNNGARIQSYEALTLRAFGRATSAPNTWPATSFTTSSQWGVAVLNKMKEVEVDLAKSLFDSLNCDGDIVEFGVYQGQWLERLMAWSEGRTVYGFDSFEGLPSPGKEDQGMGWHHGQYAASLDEVSQAIGAAHRSNVHLVKGWFKDTLARAPATNITKIAFARIDCDLYSSTCDCLAFLRGRLADGAILVFDDWTFDITKGETKAFFEWEPSSGYHFELIGHLGIGRLYLRATVRR